MHGASTMTGTVQLLLLHSWVLPACCCCCSLTPSHCSDEDEEDKARRLPVYLRTKADRRRDIPAIHRKAKLRFGIKIFLKQVAKTGAEAMFRLLDDNGDGQLTRQEFRNGIKKLGIGLEKHHVNEFIDVLDPESKGDIGERQAARSVCAIPTTNSRFHTVVPAVHNDAQTWITSRQSLLQRRRRWRRRRHTSASRSS